MSARILKIDPQRPDAGLLAEAARVLAQGGLVVFPTETLYGIATDTANHGALERLARLKGGRQEKPFGLILASREECGELAELPVEAEDLTKRHWPGPLTLVLAARPGLHPSLVKDGGVGVRLSPHPVAAGLAAALGRAITATSANLSGDPAPARVEDLHPELAQGVDLILDAGPSSGGPASTVLDTRVRPWRLLRPGAVELLI